MACGLSHSPPWQLGAFNRSNSSPPTSASSPSVSGKNSSLVLVVCLVPLNSTFTGSKGMKVSAHGPLIGPH
jgi:hypothetical protein